MPSKVTFYISGDLHFLLYFRLNKSINSIFHYSLHLLNLLFLSLPSGLSPFCLHLSYRVCFQFQSQYLKPYWSQAVSCVLPHVRARQAPVFMWHLKPVRLTQHIQRWHISASSSPIWDSWANGRKLHVAPPTIFTFEVSLKIENTLSFEKQGRSHILGLQAQLFQKQRQHWFKPLWLL